MKHIFVDTNIIIDLLADRLPFSDYAAKLFQLAKDKKIKIYISAITINNTYYVLKRISSHNKVIKLLEDIENRVEIIPTNQNVIKKALKSDFKDFEDAIQYYSAIEISKMDIIVTRNSKDFKKSELPVLSAETCIKLILADI